MVVQEVVDRSCHGLGSILYPGSAENRGPGGQHVSDILPRHPIGVELEVYHADAHLASRIIVVGTAWEAVLSRGESSL